MLLNYGSRTVVLQEQLTLVPFLPWISAGPRAWRRTGTSACERARQHEVGERIHGFTVSQVCTAQLVAQPRPQGELASLSLPLVPPCFTVGSTEWSLQVKGFPDS